MYAENFVPLHRPIFSGNEKKYLLECIDSNFVSYVGKKVVEFEEQVASYTKSKFGVAMVNGSAALHTALRVMGVNTGDEVITQPVTFVATCNAIAYQGAMPVFGDVDLDTLGLSPDALLEWLEEHAQLVDGKCVNNNTGARISACVPMHTFGIPCRIKEIIKICNEYQIPVIEDAAESLGSYVEDRHTGTFGSCGTFSFNGNKIITTGGGGMLISDREDLAVHAKHLSTTAKRPQAWELCAR